MYNYGFPMNYPNYQPRTDIGQVNNEQEAVNAYVAAGSSKIMFTPDDKTVFVKCVSMNGQTSMDIFDRRASEPVLPTPEYVTREELDRALKALKSPKNTAKTEAAE
jgi:hypothetical protein